MNDLVKVELRALTERLQRQSGGLSEQIINIDSLSQQQAAQALNNLAADIRRLRQEGAASVD
ncbi:hypothetical protein [Alcaligenes aquatilis]|uniref:hypothetical protein n=1 Tax=Alcaligenes aquatilis TaxID=323284 RepID=UPI003D2280D0